MMLLLDKPMKNHITTKKLALLAMCTAVAMVLSFVESQIPAFVPIPGVKAGLANIAVIFCLYRLGKGEAVIVSLVRVFLVSLLFGSIMSLWYSLAGAVISYAGMVLMKRSGRFSCVSVSVLGGVLHNLGQIAMACILLETDLISYYAPFLVLSGTVAGIITGASAAILITRIPEM